MNSIKVMFVAATMTLAADAVSAFEYYTNQYLVAIWQTDSGRWAACGPNQCLWTTYESGEEAFDLVAKLHNSGNYSKLGTYGRCQIFQSGATIGPGDLTPDTVLSKAKC